MMSFLYSCTSTKCHTSNFFMPQVARTYSCTVPGIATACSKPRRRSANIYTSIAARGGGGSFKRLELYNSEEHVPIESFGTTLIHWTFFLMTRTKLAFVGFVAAGNSMWHQVLDDVKVSASLSQISPQRHATLPTHQTVPSTTPYYKVLKKLPQYYSVLQSTTPVLLCTTKYYSRKYYSSTTKY